MALQKYTVWDLTDTVQRVNARRCAEIAEQNDRFRTAYGANGGIEGRIVQSESVHFMPEDTHIEIMVKVMLFSDFNAENDPQGDHSFGRFTVLNEGVETPLYWKIDLYNHNYSGAAEAPTDPTQTRRVLTICTPLEY